MKWYKMIEIYLKYDNMPIFGMINAFICINNHVISCINSMLSHIRSIDVCGYSHNYKGFGGKFIFLICIN